VGIALGLARAFALTRVLQNMLFGVTASDTVTFAGATLVLAAVAVAASLIPALRGPGRSGHRIAARAAASRGALVAWRQ
jgi:hypothetical protein